jgi:hydrogenase/urease accessory protein HupE
MRFRLSILAAFLFMFLSSAPVSAHNDTMAASRWFIGNDRVVVLMEIGPAVLAQVKGIKEGHYLIETCTDKELQEVVAKVLQPYLEHKLTVSVNSKPYPVKLTRLDRESDLVWKMWLTVDDVAFDKPVNSVAIDYRLLFEETDGAHINLAYLYRFDSTSGALPNISEGAPYLTQNMFAYGSHLWEFSARGSGAADNPLRKAVWQKVWEFVLIGIKHILTGYDHLAFLLALIAIGLSVKEVLKIITAFTIAHSITLLLAAMELVTFNSRFVEIVIAVSICYVALENLLRKEVKYRWLITFGFGLIHGFGFASGLKELVAGRSDLLVSVLSFNLGVETGQMLVFLLLLPILYLLSKKVAPRTITAATSLVVFAFGFTWLMERVLSLKLL